MSKIQRTKGSGRLSEKQLRFIRKVAATGRKHPEKRKFYVFLLVILLLLFYLLSFCRKNAATLSAVLGAVLLMTLLCFRLMPAADTEIPGQDLQLLQQQQKQLADLREEICAGLPPGEQEEAFITALMEENADTVGWLNIPGTGIDYPVMQTPEDENFYLYKDLVLVRKCVGNSFKSVLWVI